MDESALERYFDKFIANDPRRTEEVGEEVGEEELFFKLLPDELLTLNTVTCDDADRICKEEDLTAESGIAGTQSRGSSSQKSSAEAKPTCASSSSALKALPVEPGTSEDPETLQEKWSNLVPVICNVISTVDLGCCLDLKFIARRMWNVQYRPKYFTGIIARIREPKATATIFRSGKIICLGTKSVEESRLAARKFVRKLQKFGFPVRFLNFKIRNIVAFCQTFPVDLAELQKVHKGQCSYEPELHNRLILDQITGIRVSFLSARCINVCGAKTRAEVDEIFHTVCRVLREYRWERTCSGALTSKPN
ncbi:TATA-box-binding protein-like isoform X1 [Neolamprologus brichardi]|uniref:TATA-box-binding protein-like isoform X1 n=1 Tax=Neolamprologus brichardi TaxID=32507 RepID=UPI0003EC3032|nr:TATA-box-binding protein-like isoform X1 [Neolamprologus brichardi]